MARVKWTVYFAMGYLLLREGRTSRPWSRVLTFVSVQYVAFFLAVLLIYWRLSHRHQIWLLVVASYGFYAAWDWRFCFLMALTTVTDFVVAIGLERTPDPRARKRLFGLSVALNLTVLGFFKYFDFFSHSGVQLFNHFGWHLDQPTLEILASRRDLFLYISWHILYFRCFPPSVRADP